MSKERIVRATFTTGAVERGSISKIYTHAYNVWGLYADGREWGFTGFSTSEDQCNRNMRAESAWSRKQPGASVKGEEVVAVEVIEARSKAVA